MFGSDGIGLTERQRELRAHWSLQTSMLEIEFGELSDCGRVREQNEDYLGSVVPSTPAEARSHGWLFALADGVGGEERGEVASRTAVECVLEGFRAVPGGELHPMLLPRLVQSANARVHDAALAGPGARAMATTLVACALRFDRVAVAHVGDSRCYLIRRGEARALTRDHTVASEQLRMGLLSAREADEAQTRHLLSRSLGTDLFVSVESSEHQVMAGDALVLCSDGLHNSIPPPEIARVVSHTRELDRAARELVALARNRDGSDNISVQIIRVRSVERVGMYRGRPYKLR